MCLRFEQSRSLRLCSGSERLETGRWPLVFEEVTDEIERATEDCGGLLGVKRGLCCVESGCEIFVCFGDRKVWTSLLCDRFEFGGLSS